MTSPADDAAVEDAFEAYLAGRPVPDEAADLVTFSEAVRATATRPGQPTAALAELLATGLLADQSSPSPWTAAAAGATPRRGVPRTRNRRRAMFIPVLFAKFLSAGAVAHAAAGAGLVLVAVTGAGAAGALPDPVQGTVATAVEKVTPLELPGNDGPVPEEERAVEPLPEAERAVAEPAAAEAVDVPADPAPFSAQAWAEADLDDYSSFGAWVSEGARNGAAKELGVRFGELVSTRAHQKGLDAADLAADLEEQGVDLDALIAVPVEPAAVPAPEVAAGSAGSEPATTVTPTGKRGNGNGNGNAGGNGSANGNTGGNGANGNGASGNGKGDARN